jgi:hypothetical protein
MRMLPVSGRGRESWPDRSGTRTGLPRAPATRFGDGCEQPCRRRPVCSIVRPMSGRWAIVRIVVGIALVGWFGVALVDRVQHDAALWRIISAVLLIGLGGAQIVAGIREQRGTGTDESSRRPRL